jgi:hypothetical protein
MTLRESKQLIRRWISERFSDERLAQVYAFNQDGRMQYSSPCACLLGVTTAKHLHSWGDGCWATHYRVLKQVGADAELAYNYLAYVDRLGRFRFEGVEQLRQRRLSAILRAQMRIRARQQEGERVCV